MTTKRALSRPIVTVCVSLLFFNQRSNGDPHGRLSNRYRPQQSPPKRTVFTKRPSVENRLAPFQGLDASKVKVVNCNRRKSLPPASVALLDGGTAKAIGETAKFLKEQGKGRDGAAGLFGVCQREVRAGVTQTLWRGSLLALGCGAPPNPVNALCLIDRVAGFGSPSASSGSKLPRHKSPQLQGFFEDLRITLIVVQRRSRRRQAFNAARHEPAFAEPVSGPGRQHEQGFQALGPGAGFDAL